MKQGSMFLMTADSALDESANFSLLGMSVMLLLQGVQRWEDNDIGKFVAAVGFDSCPHFVTPDPLGLLWSGGRPDQHRLGHSFSVFGSLRDAFESVWPNRVLENARYLAIYQIQQDNGNLIINEVVRLSIDPQDLDGFHPIYIDDHFEIEVNETIDPRCI